MRRPPGIETRSVVVLVGGGDHFTLGSTYDQGGWPLRGPGVAPGVGAPAMLPPDGWGDGVLSLSDLSGRLPSWNP